MTPPTEPKPPTAEKGTMMPTAATGLMPRGSTAGAIELVNTDETVADLVNPRSAVIYAQMVRTDARIAALFLGWIRLITRRRFQLDPGDANDVDVQRIAADLGVSIMGSGQPDPLRGRSRFHHGEHLAHALLGLKYGSYWFEIVGEEVADEHGKAWRLRKLAPRPPRTLQDILVDPSDGGLAGLLQEPKTGTQEPVRIPVEDLVGFVWQREGANWWGESVLRPIYGNWQLKRMALKADGVQKRRNSLGIPEFTPGDNTSEDTVKAYDAIGRRLGAGEEVSIAHAEPDAKFRLVGVDGTLPDALATARYHDEEYAAAFMSMWMQLGQTQTGSRALGDTFLDVFKALLDAIADDWYCGTMNEYVIARWMTYNHGVDHGLAVPKLVSTRTEESELAVADFITAIEKGVLTNTRQTEVWFRDQNNLPPLEDDEGTDREPVEPAAPAAPPVALHLAPDPSGEVAASRALSDGEATRARWRELTDREVHAAIDPHGMDQRWRDAVATFAARWPELMQAQLAQVRQQIIDAAGDVRALAQITVDPVGAAELYSHMEAIAKAAAADVEREAAAQGVTAAASLSESLRARLRTQAETTMQLVASQQGVNAGSIALRLTSDATAPAEVADGVVAKLLEQTPSWIADRIQGQLTAAQNQARAEMITGAPEPARIVATEIMDANTCGPCADVDGTEYASIDDAEADYPDGGFRDCEGGDRCRGFVFAEWGDAP